MLYTVYKTVNMLNGKEYIGFHSIKDFDHIKYKISKNGSIYKDGYLGSGKLMKKALEKYGPLSMYQELIYISEDKEEAEFVERTLVNRAWVDSPDTYNISIGGNVTILFGDDNGFYGKKHTAETIEKIQNSRNKTKLETPFSSAECFLVENPDIVFMSRAEVLEHFGFSKWHEAAKLVKDGIIKYKSENLQIAILERFKKYEEFLRGSPDRQEQKRKDVSRRFKGVKKSHESNLKRGASIRKWIEENPEKHTERMNKINKNPEKIEKTAKAHRGTKRSAETCANISRSLIGTKPASSGKIFILNEETKERRIIEKNDPIPEGWRRGVKFRT